MSKTKTNETQAAVLTKMRRKQTQIDKTKQSLADQYDERRELWRTLVVDHGMSVKDVADECGVHAPQIHRDFASAGIATP